MCSLELKQKFCIIYRAKKPMGSWKEKILSQSHPIIQMVMLQNLYFLPDMIALTDNLKNWIFYNNNTLCNKHEYDISISGEFRNKRRWEENYNHWDWSYQPTWLTAEINEISNKIKIHNCDFTCRYCTSVELCLSYYRKNTHWRYTVLISNLLNPIGNCMYCQT
jgi:hypothetical protein